MTNIVKLVIYPDARLKTKSNDVVDFNDDLKHLLDNMIKATEIFNGIGIAGVQLGYMQRILYINHDAIINYENKHNSTNHQLMDAPLVMINPSVIDKSEDLFLSSEACLSLPGVNANVMRSRYVKVQYQNEYGEAKVIETEIPLLSACIQHEINHVDGITIAEHQSVLKRNILIKKIDKFIKTKDCMLQVDLDNLCEPNCGHDH